MFALRKANCAHPDGNHWQVPISRSSRRRHPTGTSWEFLPAAAMQGGSCRPFDAESIGYAARDYYAFEGYTDRISHGS